MECSNNRLYQASHVSIMRLIANNLRDTPMVLKGGTALLLCYELDRHSEDLDFDSSKKMNLEHRIRSAVQEKFFIDAIKLLKDTDTVKRIRIMYSDNTKGIKGSLKIETSFRNNPKEEEIIIKNGIKVYQIEKLFSQKVSAFLNRTVARDLFDINYILTKTSCNPDKPSINHLFQALETSTKINDISKQFKEAFDSDYILKHYDCSDLVLSIRNMAMKHILKQQESPALALNNNATKIENHLRF